MGKKNKRKSKKSAREVISTFTKKPLDSLQAHLGRMADNSNVQQMLDAIVAAICAYGG